jgi:hypothetical protein
MLLAIVVVEFANCTGVAGRGHFVWARLRRGRRSWTLGGTSKHRGAARRFDPTFHFGYIIAFYRFVIRQMEKTIWVY